MKCITDEELASLRCPYYLNICWQCHLVENQTDLRQTIGAEQRVELPCAEVSNSQYLASFNIIDL